MYAYPIISDKTISTENLTTNLQGPCGNCTYQSLSPSDMYDSTRLIPRINDEQLIVEERYSTVNGCFGTVRRRRRKPRSFSIKVRLFFLIRSFVVISIFVIRMMS